VKSGERRLRKPQNRVIVILIAIHKGGQRGEDSKAKFSFYQRSRDGVSGGSDRAARA